MRVSAIKSVFINELDDYICVTVYGLLQLLDVYRIRKNVWLCLTKQRFNFDGQTSTVYL